jgi:hypothetical protein
MRAGACRSCEQHPRGRRRLTAEPLQWLVQGDTTAGLQKPLRRGRGWVLRSDVSTSMSALHCVAHLSCNDHIVSPCAAHCIAINVTVCPLLDPAGMCVGPAHKGHIGEYRHLIMFIHITSWHLFMVQTLVMARLCVVLFTDMFKPIPTWVSCLTLHAHCSTVFGLTNRAHCEPCPPGSYQVCAQHREDCHAGATCEHMLHGP